jgi:hypothetical protein
MGAATGASHDAVRNGSLTPVSVSVWNFPFLDQFCRCGCARTCKPISVHWRPAMNGLIYLVGLIVVIMFVLSLLGLR